jgi:hypothetical protein
LIEEKSTLQRADILLRFDRGERVPYRELTLLRFLLLRFDRGKEYLTESYVSDF